MTSSQSLDLPRLMGTERDGGNPISIPRLLVWLICCGAGYGAVMGSFGGFSADRIWQPVYSAIKVPILVGVTFAIGLPFFFVLNNMMGLREDFLPAVRALVRTQAVVTVALAALAPYTVFWYCSTVGYETALLFNAFMFAVASLAGQIALRRFYRSLLARHPRHRILLRLWAIIYAFVGIQMGWILRPFIGEPRQAVHFFRQGAFSNAYVVIAKLLTDVVTHRTR